MSEFAALWKGYYPSAFPVGWMMRAAETRWWARFHSLPLSKRYPETDDERAVLLDRQNQLAGEVLGEGGSGWLVQTHWVTPDGYTDIADANDPFQESREYPLSPAFSFLRDEGDGEVSSWKVMASPLVWKKGAFDSTLLRVADDKAGPTLWVSNADGAVFAPYDGGVDLFLPSKAQCEAIRSKHANWLSTHPEGL